MEFVFSSSRVVVGFLVVSYRMKGSVSVPEQLEEESLVSCSGISYCI